MYLPCIFLRRLQRNGSDDGYVIQHEFHNVSNCKNRLKHNDGCQQYWIMEFYERGSFISILKTSFNNSLTT